MKHALASMLILSAGCNAPRTEEATTGPARIARDLVIGGLTFDGTGKIKSALLPVSGAELVREPHAAFALTIGSDQRYPIDGLRTLEESFGRAVVELTASSHPAITVTVGGNDAAISGGRLRWFTTAVRQANDAIRETSAGEALGYLAGSSARHELHHFDSGVSTLALFDGIVPAAPGTELEARGFGVISARGEDCGPFADCFYFTGANRFPDTHLAPLHERGSYLYHPGHPATGSADFTVAFWFKPDPSRPLGGSLFEKGLLGYGVNYLDGAIGGHFSGDQPGAYHGIYRPVVDPRSPEWHHVAYSYSRAEQSFRFYVDGELAGPVEPVGIYAAPYASTPVFVGTSGTPFAGSNFGGWMNDVRLYDRAVASDGIRAMTDAAKSGAPEPTDGPVLAWSAGRPAPTSATVRAELGSQRVVYLVPLLEGPSLPNETIQLTFTGLRRPERARIDAAVPVRVVPSFGRTLVVEIDSMNIGVAPVRIAIVEE